MADFPAILQVAGPLILEYIRIPRGVDVPAWSLYTPLDAVGMPSDVYQLAAALDNAQTELEEFRDLYELANDMDFQMVCPDRLHTIRATPEYFDGLRRAVNELRQITMHPPHPAAPWTHEFFPRLFMILDAIQWRHIPNYHSGTSDHIRLDAPILRTLLLAFGTSVAVRYQAVCDAYYMRLHVVAYHTFAKEAEVLLGRCSRTVNQQLTQYELPGNWTLRIQAWFTKAIRLRRPLAPWWPAIHWILPALRSFGSAPLSWQRHLREWAKRPLGLWLSIPIMGLHMDRYALPLGFKIPVDLAGAADQLRGSRIHTESAFRTYVMDMDPVLRTVVSWMTLWHPTSTDTSRPGQVARQLRPILRGWSALVDHNMVANWHVTDSQVIAYLHRLLAAEPGPNQMYALEPANYMQPHPIED